MMMRTFLKNLATACIRARMRFVYEARACGVYIRGDKTSPGAEAILSQGCSLGTKLRSCVNISRRRCLDRARIDNIRAIITLTFSIKSHPIIIYDNSKKSINLAII